MPKRIERNTGLTALQKEYLLTGGGWLAIAGTWPRDAQREAWEQSKDELMREWFANPRNLFSRPDAWWKFTAPEERCTDEDEGYETEPCYLARHPELLTPAECEHLKTHGLTRWQMLPCSEMASLEHFQQHENFRALLEPDELAAFEQHISTAPAAAGTIQ